MSSLKIALLKQSSRLHGGLEKQTLGVIRALLKRGCKVDLLCQGPCEWPKLDGLDVYILSQKRALSYLSLLDYDRQTIRWLNNHSYDRILGLERHSIQTHYRAGSGVHRFFLDERKRSCSWLKGTFMELNPFHRLVLQLEAKTYSPGGAKRIYTNSNMVAGQIRQYYQTEPNRIKVIHNGVPWQELGLAFEKKVERLHSTSSSHPNRYLGFIGNGYERKGLKVAMQALAQSDSCFHLVVAGHDRCASSYKEYACQLGIDSRIQWLGPKQPASSVYSMSEALILPTQYDPCANVTLEAMAMGMFVITSENDGASECIQKGSGLFLPIHSINSWSEAISQLWNSPLSLERQHAIRQSVAHLEWQDQLDKLIDDLISHT